MTLVINSFGAASEFNREKFTGYIEDMAKDINGIDLKPFLARTIKSIENKEEITTESLNQLSILNAVSYMSRLEPNWSFLCARLLLNTLYSKAKVNRNEEDSSNKYGSFYNLINMLTEQGIYHKNLLETYTEEEINELGKCIDPEKDNLFTYIGIYTLADRYLAVNHKKKVFELPQERWMIIAMDAMRKEPEEVRMDLIKEAYWCMSNLYITVATPTMANSGKTHGQKSSCFIDIMGDDLRQIYDNNTDMAMVSKDGGGVGIYAGKVRALGSSIKGFYGIASGTNPWLVQLNNTAVSVDQLGQRKGAFAVYQDAWHKDVIEFLENKVTSNGDVRQKTPDIFLGVCIPDLFMEQLNVKDENGRSVGEWHLFDPHEVKEKMGYNLEDCYDEEKGKGTFRTRYAECVANPELSRNTIKAMDLMKVIMKIQLEEGVPYMFYRDEVNRKNPNKHKGMIYCSNLCTEIAQNLSATEVVEKYLTEDGLMVEIKKPGDFVVCNLSSISLARAEMANVTERVIDIQVRLLDNVIDTNNLPVLQGEHTNKKYRPVGLGTYGWHHLLALKKIKWESQEAVDYADELYERIAFLTIRASAKLAKEKGSYSQFEGSDWHTGKYFEDRGYSYDPDWEWLKNEVMTYGIRNGYLMAVAPNSTTAKIAGSTDGIDPIFNQFFVEEKKNYLIPVTVPDLNAYTNFYYKAGRNLDQKWSIRQNAARQRHIDQAISFNLYIKNNIKASELLELHMLAWELESKTTYYVRNTSKKAGANDGPDPSDCEYCQ